MANPFLPIGSKEEKTAPTTAHEDAVVSKGNPFLPIKPIQASQEPAQEQTTPQETGAVPFQDVKLERTTPSGKVAEVDPFKDLEYDKLSAADKQGVWILDEIRRGRSKEDVFAELGGLQEPMYGPDDLIADMVTGFAYSGYRIAARQSAKLGESALKKGTKVALKGVGVDVGFGAIAGGAMTAANMATDNMLVTTVSGLLSPAGAKVFFSLSRASLKQFMKSLAIKNPKVAKELAEELDKVEVKTKGGEEVKKTIKEQVDEQIDKQLKKAAKPKKPETIKEAVKPKGDKAKLAAAHKKAKAKKVDKDIPETLKDSRKADELGQKLGPKKAKALKEKSKEFGKKAKKLSQKKDKTEKEFDEQMQAATQEQFFREAAERAEGKAPNTAPPSAKKKLEAQAKKQKKTKSFSEKKVKAALAEADVKKPKVVTETEIKGDDFLNLTTGSDVRKDAIIKKVKEGKMEGKTTKSAPILVVDKDGKVIGHDGRYRAAQAAQEGKKIKTLVVSEADFEGGSLSSQKFGTKDRGFNIQAPMEKFAKIPEKVKKAGDLREGIIGGGTLPKPKIETKARPWSKLDKVAVINRKTGEVIESEKKLPFKPSESKNIGKIEQEIRRLRAKMIKAGVSPEDIENGFIANDNLKFVPRKVQMAKVDIKDAVEKTIKLRQDKIKTHLDKEARKVATREAKLKKMAKPTAVHRIVFKANKKQAEAAAKSWWQANPELRKGLDLNEIVQAAQDAVWQHIRLTPMADLKKYAKGNKQIKAQIGGKINNVAKWMVRDHSKELLRQKAGMASINAVKRSIDEGTFKTPLSYEDGKVSDLVSGIQDPELRKAAELGISPDELLEGVEAGAKKVSVPADLGRDYKIMMRRTVLPKAGKASAFGKKEISKRARKAARKRAFKLQLEAQQRGELIKKTEAEVKAEKAKQAELQKKIADAKKARDEAQTKKKGRGLTHKEVMHQQAIKDAEAKFQTGEFRLGQREAQLAKLRKADKTLQDQGFESLIRVSADVAEDIKQTKRLAEATKTSTKKDLDALANRPKQLDNMTLQDLAALRRKAIRVKSQDLVDEITVVMLKKQQDLEIAKAVKNTKGAGGTELYSGIPIHKVKSMLLDSWTNAYMRLFDKVDAKLSKYIRGKVLKSPKLSYVIGSFMEDFGLDKGLKAARKEFELASHYWETVAASHAQVIRDINGAFETATRKVDVSPTAAKLRARQVAGGSITAFGEKFEAVQKASRRFEKLEKKLQAEGILRDHQFKRLTRQERAKAHKKIAKLKATNDELAKKFANLKPDDPRLEIKQREIRDAMSVNHNNAIDMITRLQIHYKNSGKNYFRIIHEKIKRNDDQGRRIDSKRRSGGRYKIRRDNWQVSLSDDGHVIVKQQGKPMKTKKASDLDKMVYRGITEESRDVFLTQYFKKIAGNKEWARKSKAPGFTRMPKDPQAWGPLAGKYVSTPIQRELIGHFKETGKAAQVYLHAWSIWKQGKTIYSPRAQVRNFISNIILADIIANVDFHKSIGGFRTSWKELRALQVGKVDDEMLRAFKMDTTLMKTTFAQQEITDVLSKLDFNKILKTSDESLKMHKLFAWGLNKFKDKPRDWYQAVESAMKLTIFKQHYQDALKAGKTRKQATILGEKMANKALFDYSKVPPVIRWARNGYSPFITFMYKAIPTLLKESGRRPWKAAKYAGGLWAAQKLFDIFSGDDEDDIDIERRNLPDYIQRDMLPGQPSHIRLPIKTEAGESIYFDLSFIIPWGDVSDGAGDLNLGIRAIMPNNPVWNLWRDISANEDVFMEKPLVMAHDKDYEKWLKLMSHAYKQLAPGFADPKQWKKVVASLQGERTWTGKKKGVALAVLDAAFGLKFRTISPMEAKYFKQKDVQNFVKDAHLEAVRRYNDIFVKGADKYSPEEKTEMFNELMKDYNEDMERAHSRARYLMNKDAEKPE